MPILKNWYMKQDEWDGYTAPENLKMRFTGNVYGHPKHEDGHKITTTSVIDIKGKTVWTRSGSVYELENPEPEYAQWCEDNGTPIDPDHPFRTMEKADEGTLAEEDLPSPEDPGSLQS